MEQFYKTMLDNLYDGVYFVNRKRKITYWNKAAEQMTGYSAEELEGRFCFDNILDHISVDGEQLCFSGCPLHATIQDGQKREAAVYLKHKNGERKPVVVKTIPFYEDDEIVGAIEVFSDNFNLFKTLKELNDFKNKAFTDNLTGLPNRHYIDEFIGTSPFFNQYGTSVVFIDIDDFKFVNDTYGHNYGDVVLEEVAKTLRENVKKSDEVFRYGGEEFMAILFDNDFENVKGVAERIRKKVESLDMECKGVSTPLTISVGVTMLKHNEKLNVAIDRADKLMYQSKVTGKNKVSF